jgi:hypothetical protein
MTQSMRRSLQVLVALIGASCAFELVLHRSAPPVLCDPTLTAGFHVITRTGDHAIVAHNHMMFRLRHRPTTECCS